MKDLIFDYDMKITFSSPVSNHSFTVKCIPRSSERQLIQKLEYSIFPDSSLEAGFSTGEDSFGNRCIYGKCENPHEYFEIHVKGEARTGLSCSEAAPMEHMLGRYRYSTAYTKPGERIRDFHSRFTRDFEGGAEGPDETTNLKKCTAMMHMLYKEMEYVPGATNLGTTAEEAFSLGKGVCQDYSHIFISFCHLERIPARYVVGMLLGEGASHAWVEIYDAGRWHALDPTNDLVVDSGHIKISHGRDYQDCLINQGVFTGSASQSQEIRVSVAEKSA